MLPKKLLLKFVGIFFSTLGAIACASEVKEYYNSLGSVPMLMSDHMQKVHCAPIRNFYFNYMVMQPPFVWLDSSNFAFVCERKYSASELKYELVIKVDKREHPFASCPANIALSSKPGGLVLEKRKISGNDFVKLGNNAPLRFMPTEKLPVLSLATGTGGYIEYTWNKWDRHRFTVSEHRRPLVFRRR